MSRMLRLLCGALLLTTTLTACHRGGNWHMDNVSHLLPDLKFTLQQAGGGTVTADDFHGRITLLYFGYTHCPDVCPSTLARLRAVLGKLDPQDAAQVRLLFVTVDPDRDSAATLEEYVHAFSPDFVGLRGSSSQTRALARRYRVSFTRQNVQADGGYEMSHSSAIFVFDRDGHARLLGQENTPVADFAADLRQLIHE